MVDKHDHDKMENKRKFSGSVLEVEQEGLVDLIQYVRNYEIKDGT